MQTSNLAISFIEGVQPLHYWELSAPFHQYQTPTSILQDGPKTRRVLAQAKAVPKVKETKAKVATASPRKKAKALPAESNGKASPGLPSACGPLSLLKSTCKSSCYGGIRTQSPVDRGLMNYLQNSCSFLELAVNVMFDSRYQVCAKA